uniref:Uncharacterized protein n=1 Tax=Calidris pygmaea TaxID=425635 RepID=A0A8C3KQX3_9CHAR
MAQDPISAPAPVTLQQGWSPAPCSPALLGHGPMTQPTTCPRELPVPPAPRQGDFGVPNLHEQRCFLKGWGSAPKSLSVSGSRHRKAFPRQRLMATFWSELVCVQMSSRVKAGAVNPIT